MATAMTGAPAETRHRENLAHLYQEIFTVIGRLRSHRQSVSDAGAFRQQVRDALRQAEDDARRAGYGAEDVQLATFASVAFLDESILNLQSPVFAAWPRQPLQEEMYGHHIAGEVFFQYLEKLLGRQDSQELADVLEVFQLCLLLGFAGRYSIGGRGEIRGLRQTVGAKIQRIRGGAPGFSPRWLPPEEAAPVRQADPLRKALFIVAIASVLLAVILFVVFKFSLNSGISQVEALAGQSLR